MAFRILVDEDVRTDIKESIDWYNEQKQGLGKQPMARCLRPISTT